MPENINQTTNGNQLKIAYIIIGVLAIVVFVILAYYQGFQIGKGFSGQACNCPLANNILPTAKTNDTNVVRNSNGLNGIIKNIDLANKTMTVYGLAQEGANIEATYTVKWNDQTRFVKQALSAIKPESDNVGKAQDLKVNDSVMVGFNEDIIANKGGTAAMISYSVITK